MQLCNCWRSLKKIQGSTTQPWQKPSCANDGREIRVAKHGRGPGHRQWCQTRAWRPQITCQVCCTRARSRFVQVLAAHSAHHAYMQCKCTSGTPPLDDPDRITEDGGVVSLFTAHVVQSNSFDSNVSSSLAGWGCSAPRSRFQSN